MTAKMIPISDAAGEPTPLSLEEIATLLQALVDLKNDDDSDPLPPEVEQAVNDLMSAKKTFVKNIDVFMHTEESYGDGQNINTVKTMILETCPKLLATRRGDDEVSEGDLSDASFEMMINTDHLYEPPPNKVEDQVEEDDDDDNDENDKEIEGLEGEEEALENMTTTESKIPEEMTASTVIASSMTTSPYASSSANNSRSSHKESWDKRFQELVQFKERYGHTHVDTKSGALGSWVSFVRSIVCQYYNFDWWTKLMFIFSDFIQ
jgi:hypothetical protein